MLYVSDGIIIVYYYYLFNYVLLLYCFCFCCVWWPGNGKSLSWMGLTREKWCCTRDLVGKLDMDTCQTSIKTDILL